MRKDAFSTLWSPRQPFPSAAQQLNYRFLFLNRVFLLYILLAIGIAIYRWDARFAIVTVNLASIVVVSLAFILLRRHPLHTERIAKVMIVAAFIASYGIYLFAIDNSSRLTLFFPFVAIVLFLQGVQAALKWLAVVIVAWLLAWLAPSFDIGFRLNELVVAAIYLSLLLFILWNYEIIRDEQEAKQREIELQKQIDQRWRVAVEGAGDAIWEWDIDSNRYIASKSYADMLGYSEEEIGAGIDHLSRLLHPDDRGRIMAQQEEYLNGNFSGQYRAEHRLLCKDGNYKWILCRGRVTQRDAAGRPQHMVGTHTDITERKRIETNLYASERRLRMAFEASRMGAWSYELGTRKLYWSPEIFRLFGWTPFEPTAEFMMQRIHPDDRERVVAARDRALKEKLPYTVEYRVRNERETRWVESRAEIQFGEDGQAINMIGTIQDITERKEHEKQLQHIAHYDALTGVPNRVLLADRLTQALARAKRDRGLLAVCYLDLDGFKPINDHYGHQAGDSVLVEISRRIKDTIRENDTVARLGGDEFVVLLVGMQVPEECAGSLCRMLEVIHRPIEVMGQTMRISASIGVALYPEDDDDPDTLLRHADQAMYAAKQSGKNRYHLFDPANDQRTRLYHELITQIRHGLVHGEFELYYQPKVDLHSRCMVGAEALVRWNHPTRGLLIPDDFLRAIEDTEMEIELGDWVIATAIDQQRRWRAQGLRIELSINVSAYHLQSPQFSKKLQAQTERCCPGNCGGTLQIEVLETAALEDVAGVCNIIAECKAFGMAFALDDFGTGYSSMSYLSKFDVDALKIDQSFVRDMLQDKGDHAIVQGIIALAKAFDMGIVAEGVETAAQDQALRQMGCPIGQGYGIAPPMQAAALIQWNQRQPQLT